MDWVSLIIGLGGLAVGAYSNYLAFKDRTTSFQQSIHEHQLEAITATFETIRIPFMLSIAIVFFDYKGENDKLEEFIASIESSITDLTKEFMGESKNDFVLPENIYTKKRDLINDLHELISQRKKLNTEKKIKMVNKISKDRLSLIQESRKLIGVDELSSLNRKLFLKEKNINELMTKLGDYSTETMLKIISNYA